MILAITIACAVVGVRIALGELIEHFTGWTPEEVYETTFKNDGCYSVSTWKTHLAKPLFYCVTCMASIWGTFFYILLAPMHYFGWDLFLFYIPTIFTVALFGTWIYKLFNGTK